MLVTDKPGTMLAGSPLGGSHRQDDGCLAHQLELCSPWRRLRSTSPPHVYRNEGRAKVENEARLKVRGRLETMFGFKTSAFSTYLR